ncbi:Fc.00g057240.m01.CDS01 [Cosmosporella sp. VM-42]
MVSTRASSDRHCGHRLLTYSGFVILGLANSILPFIVFSANYLIIPYPRWIVILIETVPALVIKLLLPHFLHNVPYWMRPLSVGCCWMLTAFVTKVTPPNVAPPVRIFTTVLASASAAATDVSTLGMLRYYGRTGLAGWGAGTGSGMLLCAVLPFVFTVWAKTFLRSAIEFVYPLIGALLMASFVILPKAPMNCPDIREGCDKDDLEDGPESKSLLSQESLHKPSRQLSTQTKLDLTRAMIRPYLLPLIVAFVAQSTIFPGIAHSLPISYSFKTFFAFVTTYGFVFRLGILVSRSLILTLRPRKCRAPLMTLGLATSILLVNSIFSLFSSQIFVGLLVLCAGLMGGSIYMIIAARVMDDTSGDSGVKQEFSLQLLSLGETAGVLLGGLLATNLEAEVCHMTGLGTLRRWCNSSR